MSVTPLDLARGITRTFRWWIVVGITLVIVFMLLALGANRPADPTVLSIPAPGATVGVNGDPAFALGMIQLGTDCKRVLVADTDLKRVKGLSGVRAVPQDGMLFVYDHDVHFDFTMARTLIPLDAGFYDANGRRVHRVSMTPCPHTDVARCPKYHSPRKYRYVLETARGQLGPGSLGACTA